MPKFHDLAVQRTKLRSALRRARLRKGQTQRELADLMGWSLSKVIRIENGKQNPLPSDVLALTTTFGIDSETASELFDISKEIRSEWAVDLRSRLDEIHTPSYISYLEYEQSSTVMKEWQYSLFPGLVQTEEYAFHMLTTVFHNSAADAKRRIEARIDRQRLVEEGTGPRFHFIIDETVLARPFGDDKIMAAQLERVLNLAETERVMMQLVPFSKGLHPGIRGSFILLEFEEDDAGDVLYMELPNSEFTSREQVDETERYQGIFGELEGLATTEAEFISRIQQQLDALRRN